MKNGDLGAKSTLIEHNLRLVAYIARRFENTGINIEDLISIGTIGLIKAVNTFKLDKNIKLSTYTSRCIENEIVMHLRKTATQKEVADCMGISQSYISRLEKRIVSRLRREMLRMG